MKGTMSRVEQQAIRVFGVCAAVLMVVGISWAAQVPNQFVPKTVASSSQVNANFKYLSDRSWEQASTGGLYHAGNIGIATVSPAEKLEVTGNVKVSGDVTVGGYIKGSTIRARICNGKAYQCTIKACLALCQSYGERVATKAELFAFASGGGNLCRALWMLDATLMQPRTGYPMYKNMTSGGCGPANTGDVPRLVLSSTTHTWASTTLADCACHGL